MTSVQCISISLYDTQTPQVNDEFVQDFAERGTVKIIYDGDDSKYESLLASRCEFSLEVGHLFTDTDLFYEYLFSGSETRFKVVVRDQDENVLWEGFLLPDEYSEPYTTGTFYVRFSATDGLARLKGIYLPDSFYQARQSVSKVLADCLKNTGLSYELWILPSFKNSGAEFRWDELFVDAAAYNSNSQKSDCYEILQDLIVEMGCTLWQQQQRWYIVGINQRGVDGVSFQRYDQDGVFIEETTFGIFKTPAIQWDATPQVSILPAFKTVTVNTGIEESSSVFVEEHFRQSWIKNAQPQNPPRVKKWTGVNGVSPALYPISGLTEQEYAGSDIEITSLIGFAQVAGVSDANKFNYYLNLIDPIFIKSDVYLDFALTFKWRFENPNYGGFNFDAYANDNMWYDVLVDSTVIMSNRSAFSAASTFLWKITNKITEADYLEYTFQVEVKKWYVASGGYLDFRFYNGETVVSGADNGGFILLDNISLTYRDAFENTFVKQRSIVSTKTETIDAFHGDSVLDGVINAFVYQPFISSGSFSEINFSALYLYDSSSDPVGWALGVSSGDYSTLQSNSDRIYVKRENSDFYQYVSDVVFLTDSGNYYLLIRFYDGYEVQVQDSLLIRTATGGDPQTTSVRNNREQWQKATNNTGVQRFGYILAETYHDIYHRQQVFMEGECKGLVFPLQPLSFYFAGAQRKWFPVRIEMMPGENTSQISIMQYADQKVTDYE